MIYGFTKHSYPTLEAAAEAAVEKIYLCGISFVDGRVSPGGNNVWANNAAGAFTKDDIHALERSDDEKVAAFGEIIALRQLYAGLPVADAEKEGRLILEEINSHVEGLLRDRLWDLAERPHRLTHNFGAKACADQGEVSRAAASSVDPYHSADHAQLGALGAGWDSLPETCRRFNP